MMKNFIISIDGPAGSGKQRISKYIAKKYKFYHLDSGILYRRLTAIIIKKKIQYEKDLILKQFIKSLNNISPRNHSSLRKETIGKISSKIATIPIIRKYINLQQKKIIKNKLNSYTGCVIDGRDIGSKVFKEAQIKLFITVNAEIRAKRRHKQLIAKGEKSIYSKILKDINLRDYSDKNRMEAPMIVPKGAIKIDNSNNFKLITQLINKVINKKLCNKI